MAIATTYGTLGSEAGMTATDRLYKADGTKTGFIYNHAIGADGSEFRNGAYPFRRIAEMGYPVVAMNMAGSTWGNSAAVAKMPNAIAQLVAIGAKTSKIVLVGSSMGTITTLNSISQGEISPSQVAAVLLFVPPLFEQRIHTENRFGIAPFIDAGYGSSAAFNAAMPAYDPGQNPASFHNIPIKIFVGSLDPLALQSEAYEFAGLVGSNVVVQAYPGRSHSDVIPNVDPDDFMRFVAPYI